MGKYKLLFTVVAVVFVVLLIKVMGSNEDDGSPVQFQLEGIHLDSELAWHHTSIVLQSHGIMEEEEALPTSFRRHGHRSIRPTDQSPKQVRNLFFHFDLY